MRKPAPFGSARLELALFQCHQDAARSAHRFHRKIQDELEQLVERHVAGQFAAGAYQRLGVPASRHHLAFRGQHAVQALGHGGLLRGRGRLLDKDHGLGRGRAALGVDHGQLSSRHFVPGLQDLSPVNLRAVDEGAVGAAQVADRPIGSFALEHQMFARQPGHFAKTKIVRIRAPQLVAILFQNYDLRFPARSPDRQFRTFVRRCHDTSVAK